MPTKEMALATKVIHGASHRNPEGALATPIYQTSTFLFDSAQQGGDRFAGRETGFIYSRLGNPTVERLEEKIALLEGAEDCVAFSSGMGAISGTVLSFLGKGRHLVADRTLYGCTFSLFTETLPRFGVEVTLVDFHDRQALAQALRPDTAMVYFESPANPNMKIIDIAAVAALAHEAAPQALVVVDNTFATPILTQPLALGADIVLHSATKYLNGHGDVIAGFSVGRREQMAQVRAVGRTDITGSVLGPQEAYLILRGLKTLKIRMDAHCRGGAAVARWLEDCPLVERVYYPGLPSHPDHATAKKQMRDFGALISFEVKSFAMAKELLDHLELCGRAVSLGDCETLIQHPASMTHSMCTPEEIAAAGFSDRLIRLSVGLEDPADIIADLQQALEKAAK